jgi:hypothetical protein
MLTIKKEMKVHSYFRAIEPHLLSEGDEDVSEVPAVVNDAHLLFQVEEEDEDDPDGAAVVIDAHLLFHV